MTEWVSLHRGQHWATAVEVGRLPMGEFVPSWAGEFRASTTTFPVGEVCDYFWALSESGGPRFLGHYHVVGEGGSIEVTTRVTV